MQYTIRDVPPAVDRALRRRAREEGRSLNRVALEALARGAGVDDEPRRRRVLADLAGTWVDDPEFDAVVAEQDRIDEEMWR